LLLVVVVEVELCLFGSLLEPLLAITDAMLSMAGARLALLLLLLVKRQVRATAQLLCGCRWCWGCCCR
jgi:hypothetical protein